MTSKTVLKHHIKLPKAFPDSYCHVTIENVAFGISINDIVLPSGKIYMGIIGGGGPQTAWGMAAALGSGETVGLVARVGSNLPPKFFTPLEKSRINLDGIQFTSLPTPRAWEVVELDETRTHLWRVTSDILAKQMLRGWKTLPIHYQGAKNFHWGVDVENCDRDVVNARRLRVKGKNISLEPYRLPDYPLKLNALQRLVKSCNIFSLSWSEACRITGDDEYSKIVKKLQEAGCEILILHRDKHGAEVWNFLEGHGVHVPAVQTHVIDVIGAGNTFSGGFITQLHNGVEEAACHASVVASYMIEQVGLPKTLPNPVDYNKRLQEVRLGIQRIVL